MSVHNRWRSLFPKEEVGVRQRTNVKAVAHIYRPTSLIVAIAALSLVLACFSQAPTAAARMTPAEAMKLLSFEDEHTDSLPKGWFAGPPGTIAADSKVVHGGKWSVRLERNSESTQSFSTITKSIPIDFAGTRVELRGHLRTESVSGFAGLWLREDGDTPALAFDNMERRGLKGTTEWAEYSIVLPLHAEARQLFFGVLITGTGKAWADDLQVLVDGRPFWEAPMRPEPQTVLSQDHEFDRGSKITLSELTPIQIENLAVLGKTWGFLKYHHPQVTGGKLHFDYELFRIMPAVLSATDSMAARQKLQKWVAALGPVESCTQCATMNSDRLHLSPRIEWLSNTKLLGGELSGTLRVIHRNRPDQAKQFYVAQKPRVGNPVFNNEPGYSDLKLPDSGYQLLSLFRFWNIIEYWFPYRDIIGENWDAVLTEFIPRIGLAQTRDAYQLQMMALIARVNDTHASLWSSLNLRPPAGTCQVPVELRFIGKRVVVSGYAEGQGGTLKTGDVIEALDGTPVSDLVAQWAPYYAASNEPTRLRDIARAMLRGNCADAVLRVSRGDDVLEVKAPRIPQSSFKMPRWHDLPGGTFRKLSEDVAYLKLSAVKEGHAKNYVEAAAGTKGLVIDIRNYPSSFMVFELGSHLVSAPTPFARFTRGDLSNPGGFVWEVDQPVLEPAKPHYEGKVVILVDEVTQSSAEYTAMAFRASPRATVVGSTTAAADGNVSPIPLPGGLNSGISGIGVFYPDKRATQRIGIVPDHEVKPTVEGIRAGRDEVLEQALRLILGDNVSSADIEKMARR